MISYLSLVTNKQCIFQIYLSHIDKIFIVLSKGQTLFIIFLIKIDKIQLKKKQHSEQNQKKSSKHHYLKWEFSINYSFKLPKIRVFFRDFLYFFHRIKKFNDYYKLLIIFSSSKMVLFERFFSIQPFLCTT